MEEELKNNDSDDNKIYDFETEDILKSIDCQKLANLLSDEKFLGKFMKTLSKDNQESKESEKDLSEREMGLPDIKEILENI